MHTTRTFKTNSSREQQDSIYSAYNYKINSCVMVVVSIEIKSKETVICKLLCRGYFQLLLYTAMHQKMGY